MGKGNRFLNSEHYADVNHILGLPDSGKGAPDHLSVAVEGEVVGKGQQGQQKSGETYTEQIEPQSYTKVPETQTLQQNKDEENKQTSLVKTSNDTKKVSMVDAPNGVPITGAVNRDTVNVPEPLKLAKTHEATDDQSESGLDNSGFENNNSLVADDDSQDDTDTEPTLKDTEQTEGTGQDDTSEEEEKIGRKSQDQKKQERQQITDRIKQMASSLFNIDLGPAASKKRAANRVSARQYKDQDKKAFRGKNDRISIYRKLVSDRRLKPNQVGVGWRDLAALVVMPGNALLPQLQAIDSNFNPESATLKDDLFRIINNSDIRVAMTKSPTNEAPSTQRRQLRVTKGFGIRIHPMSAKTFNADFDGDAANVTFGGPNLQVAEDTMAYMLGIDGEAMVDPDFFPMLNYDKSLEKYLIDNNFSDIVTQEIFNDMGYIFTKKTTSKVKEAIFKLGIADDKEAALKDLASAISEWSSTVGTTRQEHFDAAADMWFSIYNVNHYIKMFSIELLRSDYELSAGSAMPYIRTEGDARLRQATDMMAQSRIEGKPPMNFLDFKVMMNAYPGEVDKKNVAFRFSGNVIKTYHFTESLSVTSDEYWKDVYDKTLLFAESKAINNVAYRADKEACLSEVLKNSVIKELAEINKAHPFDSFGSFLIAFRDVYERKASLVELASVQQDTDSIIRKKDQRNVFKHIDDNKLSSILNAFMFIFGNYSMESIFGSIESGGGWRRSSVEFLPQEMINDRGWQEKKIQKRKYSWLAAKYGHMTLNEFKDNNSIITGRDQIVEARKAIINRKNYQKDPMDYTNAVPIDVSDYAARTMIELIANQRTSSAAYIEKSIYAPVDAYDPKTGKVSDVSKYAFGDNRILKYNKDDKAYKLDIRKAVIKKLPMTVECTLLLRELVTKSDFLVDQIDAFDTLYAFAPQIFDWLEVRSYQEFLDKKDSNKYIKELLTIGRRAKKIRFENLNRKEADASTTELFNVADQLGSWRLRAVFNMRMRKTRNEERKYQQAETPQQQEAALNNVAIESRKRASSGQFWRAFEKEMKYKSAWKSLIKKCKEDNNNELIYCPDFWKSSTAKRTNLAELMARKDPSYVNQNGETVKIGYQELKRILGDVVRENTQEYVNDYEVGYQLEFAGSDVHFNDVRPTSEGLSTSIEAFRTEYKKNTFGTSMKGSYDDIFAAYTSYKDEEGALDNTIHTLATNPQLLIHIDDDIFAVALTSVLDKVSAQSEKGSQHPWTNRLYSALATAVNGRPIDDLDLGDDTALGLTYYKDISIIDIVKMFDDPSYTLMVYGNDSGPNKMNLGTLFDMDPSKITEKDKWQWLLAHPNVAACFREHTISSLDDKDGGTYLTAVDSISETIETALHYNGMDKQRLVREKLKRKLIEHPSFGAMVSLGVPAHNRSSRTMVRDYQEATDILLDFITAVCILVDGNNKELLVDLIKLLYNMPGDQDIADTLANLDVPSTVIVDNNNVPIFKGKETLRDSATDAQLILIDKFEEYAKIAKEICDEVGYDPRDTKELKSLSRPDLQSLHGFYEIRQEFCGAKTSISTSINGNESWEFALWAALIGFQDSFMDLGSFSKKELTFVFNKNQGVLFNAYYSDGSPVADDEGNPISVNRNNVDSLLKNLKEDQEIIIAAPDGYTVPDKRSDPGRKQMGSVNTFLMIKRDRGAEAFNLKVKKFGDDGTDSILKNFKYEGDTSSGERHEKIVKQLNDLYAKTNDLFKVKIELAKVLKDANESLNYRDFTMANYVCLADMMITVDSESGTLCIRSLEQILRNMHYAFAETGIASLDASALKEQANEFFQVIHGSLPKQIDVDEYLIDIKPAPPMAKWDGISSDSVTRKRSSSSTRNFALLDKMKDLLPLQMRNEVVFSPRVLERISNQAHAAKEKIGDDRDFPGDFFYMGDFGDDNLPIGFGPQSLYVLKANIGDKNAVMEMLRDAYRLGATVYVLPEAYDQYLKDTNFAKGIVRNSYGQYILPMFDMRLNGSEAFSATPKFSVFNATPEQVVWSTEDPIGDYRLGDSETQIFKHMADRIQVSEQGDHEIAVEDIFAATKAAFPDATLKVTNASEDVILHYVINNDDEYTIDYGVIPEDTKDFEHRKEYVDRLIRRYRSRWDEMTDGQLIGAQVYPGEDIVGWMDCEIILPDAKANEAPMHCLAPIIPFVKTEKFSKQNTPTGFVIPKASDTIPPMIRPLQKLDEFVHVPWAWLDDITDHFIKIFEGAGSANKQIGAIGDAVEGPVLKNGVPLDFANDENTTKSRRVGWDKRMKTMDTLMFAAREKGYNFAELDDAFPDDPEMRDGLLHGTLEYSDWAAFFENNPKPCFYSDAQIDSFVRQEVKKYMENGDNPSNYLATMFQNEKGEWSDNKCLYWEFDCMFEPNYYYEENLLRFMHEMMPGFCPPSLLDDIHETYLFKPCQEDKDFGCLQMQVEHQGTDGRKFFIWQNVYAGWSMFSRDFSGYERTNTEGAAITAEVLNAMGLFGNITRNHKAVQGWLKQAMSDVPSANVYVAERDDDFDDLDEVPLQTYKKLKAAKVSTATDVAKLTKEDYKELGIKPEEVKDYVPSVAEPIKVKDIDEKLNPLFVYEKRIIPALDSNGNYDNAHQFDNLIKAACYTLLHSQATSLRDLFTEMSDTSPKDLKEKYASQLNSKEGRRVKLNLLQYMLHNRSIRNSLKKTKRRPIEGDWGKELEVLRNHEFYDTQFEEEE